MLFAYVLQPAQTHILPISNPYCDTSLPNQSSALPSPHPSIYPFPVSPLLCIRFYSPSSLSPPRWRSRIAPPSTTSRPGGTVRLGGTARRYGTTQHGSAVRHGTAGRAAHSAESGSRQRSIAQRLAWPPHVNGARCPPGPCRRRIRPNDAHRPSTGLETDRPSTGLRA